MRVGIVGLGFFGSVHLERTSVVPGCVVTAVADANPRRAAAVVSGRDDIRVFTNYLELVQDDAVDLVSVVTPPALHLEVSLAAIAAGKHVLCEKPIATSVEQAEILSEAAAQANIVHAVGHEYRYEPAHRFVRDLIQAGYVGRPELVTVTLSAGWARHQQAGSWSRSRKAGGGLVLQVISHYIDLLHFHFGKLNLTASHVVAMSRIDDGSDVDDRAEDCAVLAGSLGDGGMFVLQANWASPHPNGERWEVQGDDGYLVISKQFEVFGSHGSNDKLEPLSIPDPYRLAVLDSQFPRGRARPLFTDLSVTGLLLCSELDDIRKSIECPDQSLGAFATFHDGVLTQRVLDAAAGREARNTSK